MPPRNSQLERLRAQVDSTDRQIASAIAHRFKLAAKIGLAKSRSNAPLRDYATEQRVLARWQRRLATSGVEPSRSVALARWLIEESLRVQEARPTVRGAPHRTGSRIGVIGGAGAMGRWLEEFLTDAGHEVYVVDPNANPAAPRTLASVTAAMERCGIVVFSTPIRATAPLLAEALERPSDTIVFDVLSVKAPVAHLLRTARERGIPVSSAHPMFGPSARTLSGRNLLLVSCGSPEADQVVRNLFSHSALTVTEVPLGRHDRLIAESLGLAHAVNLLFLSALASDPLTPPDLASAASTTFHRQSTLAAGVAKEGPELYLDIQSLNPHSREVYSELRSALDRLEEIVGRHDLPGFRALLSEGRAKLTPGSEPMRA